MSSFKAVIFDLDGVIVKSNHDIKLKKKEIFHTELKDTPEALIVRTQEMDHN